MVVGTFPRLLCTIMILVQLQLLRRDAKDRLLLKYPVPFYETLSLSPSI